MLRRFRARRGPTFRLLSTNQRRGKPHERCRNFDAGPDPGIHPVDGSSASAVDAVHDRILGAFRVLRDPLGAGAVHRRPVPRRRRHRRGLGQPDLRRLPGAGVRGGDLRRLRGRQDHRVPALDPGRRDHHGRRPVHDLDAGRERVQARPGHHHRRQRPVQAEHLDHGRQAVFAHRRAPGFRLHPVLHGHQPRRDAGADPDRLPRRAHAGRLVRQPGLQGGVHRLRRRHAGLAGVVLVRPGPAEGRGPSAGGRRGWRPGADDRDRRAGGDPGDLLPAVDGRQFAAVGAHRDVRGAGRHAAGRGHPRGLGGARQGDRVADHLRLQRAVLDVLRAGRQFLQLPVRQDRGPRVRRYVYCCEMAKCSESACDHYFGACSRADIKTRGARGRTPGSSR